MSWWNDLNFLKPGDFQHPDKLNPLVVARLDQFIGQVGRRPNILSDFRPGDPRQHGDGNAIDTSWPGLNPLALWNQVRAARLFNGLGVYVNEQGAASFHFDVRPDRTADNPALWGGLIEHRVDTTTGQAVRDTTYVAATTVLDELKKKSVLVTGSLVALILALWLWPKRR